MALSNGKAWVKGITLIFCLCNASYEHHIYFWRSLSKLWKSCLLALICIYFYHVIYWPTIKSLEFIETGDYKFYRILGVDKRLRNSLVKNYLPFSKKKSRKVMGWGDISLEWLTAYKCEIGGKFRNILPFFLSLFFPFLMQCGCEGNQIFQNILLDLI